MKLLLSVYFCLSFSFAFVSLAVSLHFLKTWQAKDLPLLYAAISAPWAAKPVLGTLVDRLPLDRTRFVCLGFVGGGLAWALAPLSTFFLILASSMVCVADCAADAIMVAVSKHDPTIQRLSIAFRSIGEFTGTLLGGLVYLGGYSLTMHMASLALIPIGIAALDLPRTNPKCAIPRWTWTLTYMQIIGFLLTAVPTPSTFILMSWTAGGMSAPVIALASVSTQLGSLLGLWIGKKAHKDISVWGCIVTRMLIGLSSCGTHLAPVGFAIGQNLFGGFAGALFLAPFIEETTRLVPLDGNEAFTYSAVMAALNLGGIASSGLESLLMSATKLETADNDPVPLVSVCLFLSLLAFPLGTFFQGIRANPDPERCKDAASVKRESGSVVSPALE